MESRYEIDYYQIEGSPGGNQDWCTDFWMNLGGCAALAAGDMAICLALNYGLKSCCPFDPLKMGKEDYDRFAMILKPYIRPRFHGVTKLTIFTEGFRRYLKERGYETGFQVCQGNQSYEEAEEFVRDQLKNNLPIACLTLSHSNPDFKDLNWHWFSITGYEWIDDRVFVIIHTYGEKFSADFQKLWDTGSHNKGGLISLSSCRAALN